MRSMRSIAAGEQAREPEAALAAEDLLRREVVRVELAWVDAQAAGGRRGVDEHEPVGGVDAVGPVGPRS